MKLKKLLGFLLAMTMIVALLSACGSKEKTIKSSINPELISAFGEEMIKSEEDNIAELVGELKTAYKQYKDDYDLDAFVISVDDTIKSYEGYLGEISDELMNLYEEAKAADNQEKMMELLSTHMASIAYFADATTISIYRMNIDWGQEQWHTDREIEEALCNCINEISEFFYCKPIAE
ncbi:MAG: hypothetical protein IKW10_00105 [Oscillospiraceae bacterium]|nr:hypothetical protein [Oscillospiraceae bacterium]